MDESILEDLGLTNAEIKVYIALLELGSSSAGPILEKSKLHNSVVHRNLDRLIEKGLITYVLEGKKRYYQAVNPKLLLNYVERKKQRLQSILPELIAKQKQAKQPEARIFRGKRGIKELLYSMLQTGAKEYVAYGGPQKAHDLLGDYFWASFHKRRRQKRIKAKLIFHSNLRWWGKELKKQSHTTVRFTSKNFEELTETIISGDQVGIIIYLDQPYGFLIKEKTAAKSYKDFFTLLWKQS